VARAAGVSPSTVSNVYNRPEVVSPELRERVLRAASDIGYAGADPAARSLRSGRTGAIGVVLRERLAYSFDDPAAVRFLQGVSDAADPQQLALVIVPAYPEQAGVYSAAINRAAVDGLLLYSLVADDPLVEASLQRRLPTVVVDSPVPANLAAATQCGFVGIDERTAAETAVAHLTELGHRRLAVLSLRLSAGAHQGPAGAREQAAATASVARGRLEGARRAAEAAGVGWDRVAVEQCLISDVESGRAGAHALLDRAPDTTAIFALSDALALGARLAAGERHISVAGDLSISGFDDSAPEADGLTTIHQPLRQKGLVATELLLRMLAGENRSRALLPTRLIVRGSTGPVS